MNLIVNKTTMYRLLSIVKQARSGISLAVIILAGVIIHNPLAAQQISLSSVKVTPVPDNDNEAKLLVELTGSDWSPGVNVSVSLGTEPGSDNLQSYWYRVVKESSASFLLESLDGEVVPVTGGGVRFFIDDYPLPLSDMELWSEVCVLTTGVKLGCRNIRIR